MKCKWIEGKLKEIMSLNLYRKTETIGSVARKMGLKPSEILKLNANENFFIPKEEITKLLLETVGEIDPRIYPQDEKEEFREALAKYLGVSPECILVDNGSDQLMWLIAQTFLERESEALSVKPTFSMYEHVVNSRGATFTQIPLKDDFSLDVDSILASAKPNTRLLFLCSPNNPTANQFKLEDVLRLVEEFRGLVVVDEAYADFAEYSLVNLAEKYENLIVLRTFSKFFGLAGLRLGYTVSNMEIAEALSGLQLPYTNTSLTLKIGLKILENIKIVENALMELKRERKLLLDRLNSLEGVKAFNSQTNFILFQTRRDSDKVFQRILKQGVLIRKIGKVLKFDNCLRTTVGLRWMNDKLIEALECALVE